MGEGYALEWLDNLITVTLNPVNPKHVIASPEDIAKLERLVIEEKNKVEEAIKTQVFNLDDDVKIKSSINKYHSSLVNLLEHAFENRSRISKHKPLKQVFNTTIACMDELLALIERRFNRYLSKDEQVPFTAAQIGWEKLGMTEYGSMCNIDCNNYPFRNSHILYTTYTPATTLADKYHNGTTLDVYINDETAYKNSLKEAIKYLFKK